MRILNYRHFSISFLALMACNTPSGQPDVPDDHQVTTKSGRELAAEVRALEENLCTAADLDCQSDMECVLDDYQYYINNKQNIMCYDLVPAAFDKICEDETNSARCINDGENSWLLVCYKHRVFKNDKAGTINCSAAGRKCHQQGDFFDCTVDTNTDTNSDDDNEVLTDTEALYGCAFSSLQGADGTYLASGRFILAEDRLVDDVQAFVACSQDLSKPVAGWLTFEAQENDGCTECSDFTEFNSILTISTPGTYYCTFYLDAGDGTEYICPPSDDEEAEPLLKGSKTTLTASQTHSLYIPDQISDLFYSTDFGFVDGTEETYGNYFSDNRDDATITAVGRPKTDNNSRADYTIDGAGIILNSGKDSSSKITVSVRQRGIGSVIFDANAWDDCTIIVSMINGTTEPQQITLKKATLDSGNHAIPERDVTFTFNDPAATGFTISSRTRVVIDNLRWNNCN